MGARFVLVPLILAAVAVTAGTARSADLIEIVNASLAASDWLEEALVDPQESGADRWGVFPGFAIGADGFVGGSELPGFYATAGHALADIYALSGDIRYLDEAEAVARYLLDNQSRATTYLTDHGFVSGGVLAVEGGNPTFYTAHQARVAYFLVELYGVTLDPAYLQAASDIAAFAATELRSTDVGTPNMDGFVYTTDISRLQWPFMFVVGYSEADMALALSRLEPHGLRGEDWSDLRLAAAHLSEVQQDQDGGLYWTNRDVDRHPGGTDVRGSSAAIALREAGYLSPALILVDWLEAQQQGDGSFLGPIFGTSDLVRENAYGTRALLDAGRDPESGTLSVALDWLVDAQLGDGSFPKTLGDGVGNEDATGVAALALLESFGTVVVTIPPADAFDVSPGDDLDFQLTLLNHSPFATSVEVWLDVVLPDDSVFAPAPPTSLPLGPRTTLTAPISLPIPVFAPLGEYTARIYLGETSPLVVVDRDGFRFNVVAP